MITSFEGHYPEIHPSVFIDKMAYVSGRVNIGKDANIWPMVVIRGDINEIHIGKRSNIQDGSVLHVMHDSRFSKPGGAALSIGNDVTVGHNVTLHGCTLHDRCLIGMAATVLDGAVIESEVMVAAGALVPPNKTLLSGYLYVGSPVKQARPLNKQELEFLTYSAQHYVKLAQRTQASS